MRRWPLWSKPRSKPIEAHSSSRRCSIEEAESSFRRALTLDSKLWAAGTGLANVLAYTERAELAESEFRRLIAEHQKCVIYAHYADFLFSLDRHEEALEMARMTVSLDTE